HVREADRVAVAQLHRDRTGQDGAIGDAPTCVNGNRLAPLGGRVLAGGELDHVETRPAILELRRVQATGGTRQQQDEARTNPSGALRLESMCAGTLDHRSFTTFPERSLSPIRTRYR